MVAQPDVEVDVRELMKHFLESRRWTCNANTQAQYRQNLKRFLRWLDEQPVQDLSRHTIRRFLYLEKERGLSDVTVYNNFRQLRTLCRWLYNEELLEHNPFEGRGRIEPPRVRRKHRRVYSDEEVMRMLQATAIAPHWKRERTTDRLAWQAGGPLEREALQALALLCLLLDSGMRAGEVCALTCGQIRQKEIIITGKGGHQGVVFLSEATRRVLLELAGEREDAAPLFRDWRGKRCQYQELRSILRRVAWRADVVLPPRPTHAFRHYYARKLLEQGVPSLAIRQLMRHQSIQTTQLYTELDTTALARIHQQASPLMRILEPEREQPRWNELHDTIPLPQLHAVASPLNRLPVPRPATNKPRWPTRAEVTQQRVLLFVGWHLRNCGGSPSHRDIREGLRMPGKGSIAKALDRLQADGLVTRVPNVARSISLTEEGWRAFDDLLTQEPIEPVYVSPNGHAPLTSKLVRVEEFARAKGLSQRELVRRSGLNRMTIRRWWKKTWDGKYLHQRTIERLCEALETTPEEIIIDIEPNA